MKSKFSPRLVLIAMMMVLAHGMISCRKTQPENSQSSQPAGKIAAELQTNQLSTLPGAISRSLEISPIHWQPWTKETLAHAKNAQRLLLCVIAMPQQPGFLNTLHTLSADKTLVDDINKNYVPVLIDGDAAREMSMLTSELCAETNITLSLPLIVWMTYEANPVAWAPLPISEPSAVRQFFNDRNAMVSLTWKNSPDYVLKNSALNQADRRARIRQRTTIQIPSEPSEIDVTSCLRQLTSLYDPYTRDFDQTGGLFPSSLLELLSAAAVHPGLPQDVRSRCMDTTRELLTDLLPSAMFDPLDGGAFASRRTKSWALPTFIRECTSQARIAVALLEAYRATGNAQALHKALGMIAFAEKSYATPEGLFAVGLMPEAPPTSWMWQIDEIRKILPAEDAEWWIAATGMKELGNLPLEIDVQREFLHYNTLGISKTPTELAAELGQPLEIFTPRFDAVKAELLEERARRIGKVAHDEAPHAPSTFRMVSAYAAAFCATGDEAYRQNAVRLLQKARVAFSDGPRLRVFTQDAPASVGAARAFLYVLALQSALDVAAITSDEPWLIWAEDLATTTAELFTAEGFAKECPADAEIIDLPIADLRMLFDDSTAGLVSMNDYRLAALGRPLTAGFSRLTSPMPKGVQDQPILYTDLLLATLARQNKVTAIHGDGLSPEMMTALERLPLRVIQRRAA